MYVSEETEAGDSPLLGPPRERVSTGARSLRMRSADGAGALPEKGSSPGCEGRIQNGLGHDEGHPDRLVARNASCGTRARDPAEPCPEPCVTASLGAGLDRRPCGSRVVFVSHGGWRKSMARVRLKDTCSTADVSRATPSQIDGRTTPKAHTHAKEHRAFHITTIASHGSVLRTFDGVQRQTWSGPGEGRCVLSASQTHAVIKLPMQHKQVPPLRVPDLIGMKIIICFRNTAETQV